MTLSCTPLSLAEVARRRAALRAECVDVTEVEPAETDEQDQVMA